MGQDPDQIRQEIAETREAMGQTVDAIGYKADVPARAKDKLSDTTTRVKDTVTGTVSQAGDKLPSRGRVRHTARHTAERASGLAHRNPLGIAAGAVAFGFLVGLAVPSTRVEDERLGTVADQVKDQVKQTGHEAVERGRDVVQQAAGSAVETAKQQGQQHGQAITERAKDSMGDIQP
jgi:ElaB/YqjD/DUF883 family membrane-anchored ribosome-binding protein